MLRHQDKPQFYTNREGVLEKIRPELRHGKRNVRAEYANASPLPRVPNHVRFLLLLLNGDRFLEIVLKGTKLYETSDASRTKSLYATTVRRRSRSIINRGNKSPETETFAEY